MLTARILGVRSRYRLYLSARASRSVLVEAGLVLASDFPTGRIVQFGWWLARLQSERKFGQTLSASKLQIGLHLPLLRCTLAFCLPQWAHLSCGTLLSLLHWVHVLVSGVGVLDFFDRAIRKSQAIHQRVVTVATIIIWLRNQRDLFAREWLLEEAFCGFQSSGQAS